MHALARLFPCCSLLGALACNASPAGKPTAESARPPTADAVPTSPSSAAPNASPGPFEVHEWGVIDLTRDAPIELAAGPGHPPQEVARPVRKPVLYFHVDAGAPPQDVSVQAFLPRGVMREAWPAGELTRAGIHWARLRVTACPTPPPSIATQMGALRASGWPTGDGFNEVFELGSYETSDAACLISGDTVARLLFYRGTVAPQTLPLSIVRETDGRLALRANVPSAGGVYLSGGDGRGLVLSWPRAGTTVPLPEKLTESWEGAQLAAALRREIIGRGLTGPEANAFMEAWTAPFFGASSAAPIPAIIYVMPEDTVAEIAKLTITPPPRALKRVMVVRHEVVR